MRIQLLSLNAPTWCKRFSVGRESTEDDQRPGRLVTVSGVETVTKINQIVRADRRMSIRMIVEAVNADKEMDKAPAHNALSVKRYLADKHTPVLEHAPYSPDLVPCDLFLFPKIKSALKGTRFESMEAVKQKTAELLKALTKEDFQHCFDQWKKRMERSVVWTGKEEKEKWNDKKRVENREGSLGYPRFVKPVFSKDVYALIAVGCPPTGRKLIVRDIVMLGGGMSSYAAPPGTKPHLPDGCRIRRLPFYPCLRCRGCEQSYGRINPGYYHGKEQRKGRL
ncbi:putative mariner transposase [Trichonephila clavipes]|nr:putative mariner transposase [Trichonephila clavipes]